MELGKLGFYLCRICGIYHSINWNGDCREDLARFSAEQLDVDYGWDGWVEVDIPGSE